MKFFERYYRSIYLAIRPVVKSTRFLINRVIPERLFTKIWYLFSFGKFPNLRNPQTLNEKINWLKLYNRKSIQTICADKIKMREYAKQKLGKDYSVPLVFETSNVEDLKPEKFPDFPVIIKTNHDSYGGFVVKNKEIVDWTSLQRSFKKRLRKNYYYSCKEWQYKNIEPKILAEKYLESENGKSPYDFKIHCFNGRYVTIEVDIDRSCDYRRNWYVNDWEIAPFYWPYFTSGKVIAMPSKLVIEKPKRFNEMVRLSEKLAEDFTLSRIDWYVVNDQLYLGEITFYHNSGMGQIFPKEWDYKLGQMLKLPMNHNSQIIKNQYP